MVKYIKIVNYMSGDSIAKQIQDIIDNEMMDEDTRLFFDKHNCVTMSNIKPLLTYFDIKNNDEIDNGIVLEEIHKSNNIIELSKETEYENSNINESSYDYSEEIDEFTHNKEEIIDKKILKEVVSLGYNSFYVQNSLIKNFFNYASTSYYLLQKFSA